MLRSSVKKLTKQSTSSCAAQASGISDRARTYRSVIINGLNKLVYFTEGDILYIAGFWDTRREPKNQARQTK